MTQPLDDPEALRQRLNELREKVKILEEEVNEFRQKRDELNAKVKELSARIREIREELLKDVDRLKELREMRNKMLEKIKITSTLLGSIQYLSMWPPIFSTYRGTTTSFDSNTTFLTVPLSLDADNNLTRILYRDIQTSSSETMHRVSSIQKHLR